MSADGAVATRGNEAAGGPAAGGDTPVGVPPPRRRRSAWELFWGGVLSRRRRFWAGRARRLPAPVLSVGNLHLGGSGKTPLVAAVARHLRDRGTAVTILSRGYGRDTRGVLIASRGRGAEASAAEVGDEPFMLAEQLQGVGIVVGEDRVEAGRHALQVLAPRPEVFVLDDGFSHLELARDLDLLAFPAHRPWGNGRLVPFGSLREPLGAARAADAVLLTGVEGAAADAGRELAERLRPFGFTGPGFAVGLEAALHPDVDGRVLLVTGVASPERVLATARALGLDVAQHLSFGDHHRFGRRSLERIERARARTGAEAVVVTAKDRAKLEGRLDAPIRELRVEATPEPAFWVWL
ncbi:MAG TPA: tetraacyldisaccharide 4'-kinase, partial [Thermoanaerobaculia bacterium]|nr:tetraacyldisaccharide 4'-kinase [Thermoanaerobaculia bacterium]